MTTSLLSGQSYDGISHIMLRDGKNVMARYGLWNLKTDYISK